MKAATTDPARYQRTEVQYQSLQLENASARSSFGTSFLPPTKLSVTNTFKVTTQVHGSRVHGSAVGKA